jgi:hypothetical protein
MKTVKILSFLPMLALVIVLIVGCSKSEILPNQISSNDSPVKITGNGAPSGTHYNLNIIGVKTEKDMDLELSSGHVIFVPLVGKSKILLSEGDYSVLDKNGTDGVASFQLPNPDPDNDGTTVYSVWARALGKQGGSATMQTGAWDVGLDGILGTADDIEVYSMYTLTINRTQGKQSFSDVSKYLLYVYVETDILSDPDGIPNSGDEVVLVKAGRYPLFDPALEDYFWAYDNNGLKLLQLRFYEVPVTVPAS